MERAEQFFVLLVIVTAFASFSHAQDKTAKQSTYVIIEHHQYDYTVRHGQVVLKVRYSDSQTSTAKPGDVLGTGLHQHFSYGSYPNGPDLSQVPETGLPIRQCVMSETLDKDGDPLIATQPTPEPCMTQNGNTLHYELSPNGPRFFTYVNFDIISERVSEAGAR
jgi:hypothetical protein